MDPRKVFPINLRTMMQKTGIQQSDICNKLNVPASTVSDWVNGNSYPRVDRMQQLADLLGVSMTDLQSEPSELEAKTDLFTLREELRTRPGMRLLFKAAKGATEEDLKDAAALIEGFKRRRDGED